MRLPNKQRAEGHNVRVILRARTSLVLLVAALVLTGCGGGTPAKVRAKATDLPTGNVNVPAGVTLTKAGAALTFGESAEVAYEPNPQRNTVLQLTVVGVTKGSIADFSSYVLDDRTRASTPYYVQVSVKNLGDGDVGQTPIPLWAVDSTNTLIQASSFTNSFTKCPSLALPTTFAPNATLSTCLAYLVPAGGTLTGVSYRPLQAFAPIVWTGALTVPPTATPTAKKKKKKA
ncbi:MAG: hypothetical protein JWQ32_1393 [Marmoricola sp.]|nr:hypothetical protein [Marmoricola sp.]